MNIPHGKTLVLALLLAFPLACLAAPADDIHALAASASQAKHHDSPYDEHDWLERFYAKAAYAPAWKPATARAAVTSE